MISGRTRDIFPESRRGHTMKLDFEGRAVVVTGATGALGEAVAHLLAGAGAAVHAPSRESRIDLTDETAVARYYAGLPPLWASIHVAGGFSASAIEATTLAEFRRMLDMNAATAFLCCREAVKNMRGARGADRQRRRAGRRRAAPRGRHGGVRDEQGRGGGADAVAGGGGRLARASGSTRSCRRSWTRRRTARRCRRPTTRSGPRSRRSPRPVAFLASPQNAVTRAALVPCTALVGDIPFSYKSKRIARNS